MTEPHVHAVREWMATETEYAKLYMERDLLLWLHAEAVWQRNEAVADRARLCKIEAMLLRRRAGELDSLALDSRRPAAVEDRRGKRTLIPWCHIHDADARTCACPEGAYENDHRDCSTMGQVCMEKHPGHRWLGPATVEAAPWVIVEALDEHSGRPCWDVTKHGMPRWRFPTRADAERALADAAGVSGTGTEASDAQ